MTSTARAAIGVAIAVAVIAASAKTAAADDDGYRAPMASIDGITDVTMFLCIRDLDHCGASSLSFVVHLASGPILHGTHGGGAGRVFGSLGMRLGGPLVGAIIGAGTGPEQSISDRPAPNLEGAVWGVLVGMVAAQAIDVAFLAGGDDDGTAPRMLSFGGSF